MLWPRLLALATGAPQAAPRDAPPTPAGPGAVIRGRVTAAAMGQPLHRVRVTVNAASPNPPAGVTDTRGVFEIVKVPVR